jgi:hypothetical protein
VRHSPELPRSNGSDRVKVERSRTGLVGDVPYEMSVESMTDIEADILRGSTSSPSTS